MSIRQMIDKTIQTRHNNLQWTWPGRARGNKENQRGVFVAVAFVDTETTGLFKERRAWDIAIIRRDDNGTETQLTVFIDLQDLDLDNAAPEALRIGRFEQRHPQRGGQLGTGQFLLREAAAASMIADFLRETVVYGVNVSFDTTTLAAQLRRHCLEPSWIGHVDIRTPARRHVEASGQCLPDKANGNTSEQLSRMCDVAIPELAERHTAMGDALWVKRWFERLRAVGAELAA